MQIKKIIESWFFRHGTLFLIKRLDGFNGCKIMREPLSHFQPWALKIIIILFELMESDITSPHAIFSAPAPCHKQE
jgi:hypothetical protein